MDFSSLSCPITLSAFTDPVICTGDGHTYERDAIVAWFDKGNRTSPVTGAELGMIELLPNHAVRMAIDEISGGESKLASVPVDGVRAASGTMASLDLDSEAKPSAAAAEAKPSAAASEAKNADTARSSRKDSKRDAGHDFVGSSLNFMGSITGLDKNLPLDAPRNHWQIRQAASSSSSSLAAAYDGAPSPLLVENFTSSDRTVPIARRTCDHIIAVGSALAPQSSFSATGKFETINPTNMSTAPRRFSMHTQTKLLCAGTARQFPGLLATGGHSNKVSLFVHRPLDRDPPVKKEQPRRSSWFGGKKTEKEEPLAASTGFWEEFALLRGSRDWVNSLTFSDDASLVLAGTRAGSLHLWSSPAMGPLAGEWSHSEIGKAHDGGEFNTPIISCVEMDSSATMAITGSIDWNVKVWDIESGSLKNGIAVGGDSQHTAPVRDIAVSDAAGVFATAGDDGAVLIWDSRVGERSAGPVAKLDVSVKSVSGCVFQPVGYTGGGNWIITSDEEGKICTYDLRKWSMSRLVYDSNAEWKKGGDGKTSWEGSRKIEPFKDVKISSEGWVVAVTEKGSLHTWDPSNSWAMSKEPTGVKATGLAIGRLST